MRLGVTPELSRQLCTGFLAKVHLAVAFNLEECDPTQSADAVMDHLKLDHVQG